MATPNAEQLKAIEHQGGVLLKAGAGSGKTFVLKEHMIYLAKEWICEFESREQGVEDFEIFIKNKFRKIVLMTFTKKAAGELAIRLHNEFKDMLADNPEEVHYWTSIVESLSYLNVSTIHGFCFRLIKMGFFPDVSSEQTILTETEYRDVLYEIFDTYLSKHAEDESEEEFIHLLLKEKSNIFDSIKGIFADPTLRLAWRDVSLEKDEASLNSVTERIVDDAGFAGLFETSENLSHMDEFKGKKWFDFTNEFNDFASNIPLSFNGLLKFYEYFEKKEFKIPTKPSIKTVDPAIVSYYESIKDLKDYLKKNGQDFYEYGTNYDAFVVPWLKLIKGLIDYIETEYSKIEGVTFSDLEYLVYQNLQDKETLTRVQSEFNYFIVDEFQDTSFIQYSILESLIGSDYKKLFCVGDLKQAIYGFRGGELGVFLDCEKKIPMNLSLKNNYRSDKEIINFNNVFFSDLFKLGDKFKGIDKHAVEVEFQAVPDGKEEQGEIYELSVDLGFFKSEEKLSNLDVDYFEALALFEKIKKIKETDEPVAILYKRLKPSLILMNLMMEAEIGFVSQTKIPFTEDPIIGIFYALIEKEFNQSENAEEYQQLIIQTYLNILNGAPRKNKIESEIKAFYLKSQYFGIFSAFSDLLESCGICNSQFSQNLMFIKTMIKSAKKDNRALFTSFNEQKNVSYSLDFYYGETASQVRIMTAHASKGLQFKHVLLGGVYTNENSMPSTVMIGKFPLSFKWSKSTIGKEKFKTPYFIYEDQVSNKKELSENKRLFYVANTRAESTLGWVNIKFDDLKRSKNQYNSWSAGIRTWLDSHPEYNNYSIIDVDISRNYSNKFYAKLENKPPFFHMNSLGIEFKKDKEEKFLLSELSVTKFATLADCPRKFYFQNICKFSPDEMALIESPEQVVKSFEVDEDAELNSSNILISSAERGTKIHDTISRIIIDGIEEVDLSELKADKNNILWVVDKLSVYMDNFKLISEKPIKFELFGYMISGIPDLIIQNTNKDEASEIWDFKTGRYSEDKLASYYFQLYTYAYSQYILGKTNKNTPSKMVLCFVDEKKLVERIISFEDVEKYLSKEIQKLNQPEVLNTQNCQYCSYTSICEK